MGITYLGTSQAIIDSPGDYIIDRDLTQLNPSLDCIIINPGIHYVTLHLRSRITGSGNTGNTNCGVVANGSAALSILGEGGSIRGFAFGIRAENSYSPLIKDVSILDALFRGIRITGDEAIIQGNKVRNIFGATWTPHAYCMGIEVSGMTTQGTPKILYNLVQNVAGTGLGETVGISVTDLAQDAVVFGNVLKQPTLLNKSFGLWVGGQSVVSAAGNLFDTWSHGIVSSSVAHCDDLGNFYINCTNETTLTQLR